MTRVLLTGGTGFVGRQILTRLLARNCDVRLVVRKPLIGVSAVEQVLVEDLFTLSHDTLKELCLDIDIVIHAAWYAVPSKYLTATENLSCLTGTLRLAQAAIEAGVTRFVGIGTCFEYDLSAGYLRTNTRLAPTTLYGSCKASAFLALSSLFLNNNQSFAWCRLFYLYGEGEDKRRLVPYIRARLEAGETAELTEGKQLRDYLDVCDAGRFVADAALGALEGAINVCSGVPISVAELAYRIADEFGRRDLLGFGARDYSPDDPHCVFGEPDPTLFKR